MSSFVGRGGGARDSGGRGGGGRDSSGGRGRSEGGGRGGGRDSGRGGGGDAGRGRGGGGGRNRHMGEISSVLGLLRAAGNTDKEILAVVNPPASDRTRPHVGAPQLPPHHPFRFANPVGAVLTNQQIIRANFFKVNTSNIPKKIYQYAFLVYAFDMKKQQFEKEDTAGKEDSRIMLSLGARIRDRHPEWNIRSNVNLNGTIGMTYNGRSLVFTTGILVFPAGSVNDKGEPSVTEEVAIKNLDDTDSRRRFKVTLTLVSVIDLPSGSLDSWRDASELSISALDSPLLSFARWGGIADHPNWLTVGSAAFNSRGEQFQLSPAYACMRGYYMSLRSCMAGLTLNCDMTVTAFLMGGEMINVMFHAAGYRDLKSFVDDAKSPRGLNPAVLKKINEVIKNAKVKLTHLGHWRKAKALGPTANHPDSAFESGGKKITVADYYAAMARDRAKGAAYVAALSASGGKLRYPDLPTINIGTAKKPVLVPAELIVVPDGQCRTGECTGDMTASMIRYSAVRPDERMNFITANDSFAREAATDASVQLFGLHQIDSVPMSVTSRLLPPAELRYAGDRRISPGLTGGWKTDTVKCLQAPPAPTGDSYTFAILMVGNGPPRHPDWKGAVNKFVELLLHDCGAFGVRLRQGGDVIACTPNGKVLTEKFDMFKRGGARIVIVGLVDDVYGDVKLAADLAGVATTCCKWKNIDRIPSGYCSNMVLKINTKLGGTNHTLISRLPAPPAASAPKVFQEPPASISWLFDKPCMFVGMDVSHPDKGSESDSIAAVVASMDGKLSQYAAHISMQTGRVEMIYALQEAMKSLLETFKRRNNNNIPAHMIIYRDGVADGQFEQVIQQELPLVKGALELLGYPPEAVKIAIVVCQKNHHTRLVYEESTSSYINPCPGLVVDSTGREKSIVSSKYIEFYLNSHAAIQGTAKPCKYALIYDEIGFKVSELQLMTYWSTYLYCRCNKSVSYATPAYYAHWASKRGRYLAAAGATPTELLDISAMWSSSARSTSMFFI